MVYSSSVLKTSFRARRNMEAILGGYLLIRQFKKDTQLFVDGAWLILMRNVEDMTVRKMMEVAQILEMASFGTVVEEFTKKFKCALTN